jgi:hypothetical protein
MAIDHLASRISLVLGGFIARQILLLDDVTQYSVALLIPDFFHLIFIEESKI